MSRTSHRYVLAAETAPSIERHSYKLDVRHRMVARLDQLQLLVFGLITMNVVVKGCGCQLSANWEAGPRSNGNESA